MQPTCIVYVSHTAELYGAERSLATLVLEQQRAWRFRPIVITPTPGPLVDLLRHHGVDVRIRRFGYWLRWQERRFDRLLAIAMLAQCVIGALRLRASLRRAGAAVVYSNTMASPFGAILASILGVPHVWHVRELFDVPDAPCSRFGPALTLSVLRAYSATVIFNSKFIAASYQMRVRLPHARTIYNGFDFPPCEEGELTARDYERRVKLPGGPSVLFVGKASPVKNHELALEALRLLVLRGRSVRFCFVGGASADYARKRADLCTALGLNPQVEFADFVEDLASIYSRTAILAVTSVAESFGRSIVEAFGEGIPAVAVRSGGVAEIVLDGRNGRLVRPGDAAALADALVEVLDDEVAYLRMANFARSDSRARFSKERYVKEIESELDLLVRRRR
ncbi:MAG TPA: glycosyltransferase family 4 protein [Candidatus Limnocylindrales bacterium]|nr:glycosyltransferase family 4 protein [Candidatus Limnocylindrales bacterium]